MNGSNLPFRPMLPLKLRGGKLMKWPLLVLSVVLLATFALTQSAPSAQAQATPSATISDTDPSPLTERALDGAELTVDLAETTYVLSPSPGQFSLQPQISGLSVASVRRVSDTRATLTLAFTGDIVSDLDLSVEVASAATAHTDALTTNQVTVTPAPPPEPVTNVSATGGPLSLYVAWGAVDNADGYVVQWKPTSESNYDPADQLEVDGGQTTSATIRDLLGNTQYDVRVYATSDFAADGQTTINSFARGTTLALGAIISATDPDPLIERTLDGAELTVDLVGTTYVMSLSPGQFSLQPADIAGLSVASVRRVSGTRATLTLAFTGNITSNPDLSVEVASAATDHTDALTTNPVTVTRETRPAQVTGVMLTPGPGSLDVTWNAVANADGYGIVYLETGQVATIREKLLTDGQTTQDTLVGLVGETEYTVQVYATNDFAGTGDFSPQQMATTLAAAPGVALVAADPLPIPEGRSSTYLISLQLEPLGNVVINVRVTGDSDVTVDTDAAADGNQGTLTFTPANYQTRQTVTVSAAQDGDVADDTATITHNIVAAQTSNEYDGVTIESLSVLVTDDDTPGVTVSEVDLTIDEGSTATYVIRLDTLPAGNVRISVSSDHDAVTVSPTAFTLTRSNWERGQTVTVRSRDDDRALPVSATLTHAIDADATTADEYDDESIASVAVSVTDDEAPVDYDIDADNLIEITNQEQLNAVHYDLDGNGVADNEADEAAYRRAFPRMLAGMCGIVVSLIPNPVEGHPGPCVGYELRNDIALSGSWTPIGGNVPGNSDRPHNPGANVFTGDFDGNANTITGLRVSRSNSTMVGLFGAIGSGAEVEAVCLADVNVRGRELVGALVGYVLPGATVSRSCSTGQVTGNAVVGGLVGWNRGTIQRSYSEASVAGFNLSDSQGPLWSTQLGGLVGGNYGTVVNTYATGAVRGGGHVAGLAGSVWNNGVVRNSYATGAVSSDRGFPQVGGLVGWIYGHGSVAGSYYDTGTSGQDQGASQVDPAGIIISYRGPHTTASPGQTTSGLQGPTAATGIYCGWDDEDVNCDGGLDVDEDVDHDGNLDVNEDADGDGNLDVDEDTLLRNGRLDSGEDKDFDGNLDVDEDLDGDGRLDTVNEDSRDAGGDGDGRLDRAAEDLNNNGIVTSYNHWNFGTASEYPCLVNVTPDCQRQGSPTLSVNAPLVTEGDSGATTPMTFTFTLTPASTQTVTAELSIDGIGSTATEGTDYTIVPGQGTTLTFAPGDSVKTYNLTVTGDNVAEPDETVRIFVGPLINAAFGDGFAAHSVPALRVATGTIVNDDGSQRRRASVTVTAADPVAVNEGGSSSYTVVLDGEPTGNVVIAMSSDNADVAAQPASLTFTTGNWDTAQTVTVRAAHDGDAADDKATVSHAVSGSDEYTGIAVASVNVAVTDDDTAGVTVSETSLNINEGGSATYTVVLDTQPIEDVLIYPFFYGEVTAQPDTLTFTPDNWQTAQTVLLSAAHDDDTENEQVIINHGISAAAESAYASASVILPSVTVSVTDDDQPEPENNAPVAEAGPDQTVDAGDEVSLDGSGSSDEDDDTLTYAWTQSSGPSVTLSDASSANPSFTAPNGDATLVFSLTVNDGTADSAADTVTVTVVVPDPQREALEAFYNATNGGSWTNNGNWLSDKPLGQWHGVSVNGQGQVTHLALRDNDLSGSLPAALGNLEALQVLSLDRNTISGRLPTQLGNLSNLTRLALNRNQLNGAIPSQLGNLSNLSIIGLARNSLSGSLPTSLGNLSGLTKLSLHDNTQLTGALPDGFVNMANLQRLAIANSGLCAPDTPAFDAWLTGVPDKPGGVQTCE